MIIIPELREALIDAGLLVPGEPGDMTPRMRMPSTTPVLRLDARARVAIRRRNKGSPDATNIPRWIFGDGPREDDR